MCYKVKPHLASDDSVSPDQSHGGAIFPITTPLDLIFCRNVMIYFDRPTQETLVNKFYRVFETGRLSVHRALGKSAVAHSILFRSVVPTVYLPEGAHEDLCR